MSIKLRWLLAAFSIFTGLASCTRTDIVERDYIDSVALRADGVVAKGWVSDAFPAEARQIKLKTNIDTNEVWARFEASPADFEKMPSSCPVANIQAVDLPGANATPWWPDYLVASGFVAGRAVFFRCGDGGIFAVPTNDSVAYFWHRIR